MTKTMTILGALAMVVCAASVQAATDPKLTCGKSKVKTLATYDKCLHKALLSFPFDKRFDRVTKCHEKCTAAFTKAENKKNVACAQEGAVADYCGTTSATYARALCRRDFLENGSSGCFP